MARTKIISRQDNDQMKLKLASNEKLLKNKRKPPTASNRRKNKKVSMDFEKTNCDEVKAENSEIRMDVNETENVDGSNSSHLVARDGSGDNNDGEGMEENVNGEGMEENVDGEGIEEDVDNDGENESDGDKSEEMEEVGANKKRKGKAQTKNLEANDGKFCGGPTDSSILYGYKCHVARDVWIGKDCVDTYLEWYNAISHLYLVNFNPCDPPPYIILNRPPPCDWNAIVNEIGRLLEVGMSSGGGEIPSEKWEYFQRALALTQSK
ncbi:hypothetical protein IFM89_033032 [Coptis chinensis]|uniref:Uncharacterized protein n=1 Tax=Coptis chinensis TaxID=261450 RepID=A0A835IIA7_9MAGN|nr:hypothetical protein IFM89_033032 [Coptis chinensis]